MSKQKKASQISPVRELEDAIERVGSASELSRVLGVSRQAVAQWRTGERPIPPQRLQDIRTADRLAA